MQAVGIHRSIKRMAGAVRLVVAGVGLLFSQHAFAQSTSVFDNTTTGTINSATSCTSPLVRNFTVSNSFTLADVNIGILATHTWRGDLQFTLQSPSGTRVQLTVGDVNNVSGDNFNVLLDDAATQVVNTDNATGNHSTTAPPFQNTFRPRNLLSAFNGQNSAGTWRLEICDLFTGADNGTFVRAQLQLTSAPASYADLSLSKALVGSAPTNGSNATWRLTVTNATGSPSTATGVTVHDILPLGFTFSSATGTGSYSATTGIWTVGSIAPGQSRTIDITGVVNASAGATVTNTAEIAASSVNDIDSTPNNGVTTEDDYASASFTVAGSRVAGTPPILACPAGNLLFDWDPLTWTAGSTANTYTIGTLGQISFTLTNPGIWLSNATFGGQAPTLQTGMTGGFSPVQRSLIQLVDMPNQSAVATTTITLPRSVMAAQFRIFDVDFGANQFADQIIVTGLFNGSQVIPVLTNGVSNYVIGNIAYGDAGSNNDSANGNIVVTFQQPVDTIVIQYGNHSLAPSDPGQQGIAVHDFTFCQPTTSISATKVSAVFSDPVNGQANPKAIPGSTIDYTISVSNTGTVEVDNGSVEIVDSVPADAKFCLSDITTGSGPVRFIDGSPASGLSYSYISLGSTTDNLAFSNDNGATYTYTPVADADGCDANVTHFRVIPTGELAPGANFTLLARFKVL